MRRWLLGAMACLVVLAGCGGDPKAEPSPSPSTAPVSTTPSPTAPVMPAAASENTKAGAIAFVRYYIELINHAQATGDVGRLQAVEDASCKSCTNGRKYLATIYGAGGHISGGAWTVQSATAQRSGDNWAVTVKGSFAPSDVFATPGAQAKHARGGPTLTNFVVWRASDWKVRTWFAS
jgi:hypothetical protein